MPTGPGSIAGMAQEPVTVAASNNPLLRLAAAEGDSLPAVRVAVSGVRAVGVI